MPQARTGSNWLLLRCGTRRLSERRERPALVQRAFLPVLKLCPRTSSTLEIGRVGKQFLILAQDRRQCADQGLDLLLFGRGAGRLENNLERRRLQLWR